MEFLEWIFLIFLNDIGVVPISQDEVTAYPRAIPKLKAIAITLREGSREEQMTNEEFEKQIEQMLAIQRQLQESDLRRAERLDRVDEQLTRITEQQLQADRKFDLLTEQQMQTEQKFDRLIDVVNLQTQRLSGVIEVLGLQNEQVQELFGRVEMLERRKES
ncbi:hypothetical protein C1752_00115 [Acaryochloris thomasi RCC1774]|uniref:Chromosome partition protein Smc n=1 Tax=Acaryochloris thomasi RCC1774 TaxID=1764569 RepID=A0A2W1JPV7_9CYAN|nr:hypothetical protein [Acaryochloris thomasi]PZD75378.1 hypothetical protein C1752_00115 [Acaryochloris thomasi RCC1774]